MGGIKAEKIRRGIKRLLNKEDFKLYVDVSACNLSCAMCPRGGLNNLKNSNKGLMSFELFKKIIDKFTAENVGLSEFQIGNWGEPLLNPELPAMVTYVKNNREPRMGGGPGAMGISTNLTYLKNPEELMESGLNHIRVSISGMTRETYSKNHRGGNIDTVLKNILTLKEIRDKRNLAEVILDLRFHDLVYNGGDAESAKKFCESNGIKFTLLKMYISCVEDNAEFHKNKNGQKKYYGNYIDLDKEINGMKTMDPKKIRKCQFRRSTVTLDAAGQLLRCCGVYDDKYNMGSFFDYKIRTIPDIDSAVCGHCAVTPMSWR